MENLPPLPPVDGILAIARGGLTLAHHLAEKLEIKRVWVVGVSSYHYRRKSSTPQLLSPLSLEPGINRILIVDDIADSGETLEVITRELSRRYPSLKIFTFTLFFKPGSRYQPDYYLHTTLKWVSFFWELGEI
jgi:xanthine phosphoribosyltransferase